MSVPSRTSIAWRSRARLGYCSALLPLEQEGQVEIVKEVSGVRTSVGPSRAYPCLRG